VSDFVDDDEFDDDFDDDDMPLAVLTPEGTPVDGQPTVGKRKRRRHAQSIDKPHKGNTKTANLAEARSANIADAQGKTTFADPGADDWRQDLANKQHGKAAAKLTSGKLTHNSGSGFGLA
jgi:hypothetical protein